MKNPAIITPEQFKKVMNSVLYRADIQKDLLHAWWNTSRSNYTDVWGSKSGDTGVVYLALAKELDMVFQWEYLEIDAAFFTEICEHVGDTHYRGRAKLLSLALEHENESKRACITMNRLITTTAALKVMAIYPNQESAPYQRLSEQDILSENASQIAAVDAVLPGFSSQQKHMVMFGYFPDKNTYKWKYYIYRDGEFSEV